MLAVAIGDPALAEIVRRNLDRDLVTDRDLDKELPHLSGDVGEHFVPVLELNLVHRRGKTSRLTVPTRIQRLPTVYSWVNWTDMLQAYRKNQTAEYTVNKSDKKITLDLIKSYNTKYTTYPHKGLDPANTVKWGSVTEEAAYSYETIIVAQKRATNKPFIMMEYRPVPGVGPQITHNIDLSKLCIKKCAST